MAQEEGPREPPPPPFSDGARRALEEGALGFLVENTYGPYDIPGIDRPNVTVKYAKEYEEYGERGGLGKPPIPHAGTAHRNIAHLHYEHTAGTGRGEFSVNYGYGVYDFHFRVARGGEYAGLTAIETRIRIVEKDFRDSEFRDVLIHQATPIAEERQYVFAVDTLRGVGKSMEKYAIDVPYEINPAVEKIKTLAEILKEEYEVKFGPFPEKGQRSFSTPEPD